MSTSTPDLTMKIAPKVSVEDWLKIDFSKEEGWQKAIDIFVDRIKVRFLDQIDRIQEKYYYEDGIDYRSDFAGFSVLALDSLLIETLQQFRYGVDESDKYISLDSGNNGSKAAFIDFLSKDTSFKTHFKNEPVNGWAYIFYDHFRCGILHQAQIKKNSKVRRGSISLNPLLKEVGDGTPDGKGLIINREEFHRELKNVFEQYVKELRDPQNKVLRYRFKIKMEFICGLRSEYPTLYFAYGSNMNSAQQIARTPSAKVVGIASLSGYKFLLNKRGKDGTGRGNIEASHGDVIWGVLYAIDEGEMEELDKKEDKYNRENVVVRTNDVEKLKVVTYISKYTGNGLPVPNDYKQKIVEGAREHGLPPDYILQLEAL